MNHEYFEKYFEDAIDVHKLVKSYRLYLCNCASGIVMWDFRLRKLLIARPGNIPISFSLEVECANHLRFKDTFRSIFNEVDDAEWNDIGEPIKTELLAHLRQLLQLDGSLTKPAKLSIFCGL
tara:strand:+ start:345 stop:710 length:366 start_codon:yes stop_codon:yes gene_type:complete